MDDANDKSCLLLVATPIGNLEDISLRALKMLETVDALACEDTRVTRKIFTRHNLQLPGKIISYHEHNEERAGRRILEMLGRGRRVALCSDAGTPGLSDPGYRIVNAVIEHGYRVEGLPGPCAAINALVLSGLPTSSFTFKGFPPRKPGKLRTFLEEEKDVAHTLLFYESPHRLGRFLAAAHEIYGERMAAVCVEMTKKFERVSRGCLGELKGRFIDTRVKGEVTVVIAGNRAKEKNQETS